MKAIGIAIGVVVVAFSLFEVNAQGISNPCTTVTSSTVAGCVKPDGTTITNSSGSISVTYGTSVNTAAQGNDSRITGAAQQVCDFTTASDASGAGLSISQGAGGGHGSNWCRIGDLVFHIIRITYPATVDATEAQISFSSTAPAASANSGKGIAVGPCTTGLATAVYVVIPNGTSNVVFQNTAGTAYTNAGLSGQQLQCTLTYFWQ